MGNSGASIQRCDRKHDPTTQGHFRSTLAYPEIIHSIFLLHGHIHLPAGSGRRPSSRALLRSSSDCLSPGRILIRDRPVDKRLVLRSLAEVAVAGDNEVNVDGVVREIAKREKQGSTFLNEGVALPRARIEKLAQPIVALGVTPRPKSGSWGRSAGLHGTGNWPGP